MVRGHEVVELVVRAEEEELGGKALRLGDGEVGGVVVVEATVDQRQVVDDGSRPSDLGLRLEPTLQLGDDAQVVGLLERIRLTRTEHDVHRVGAVEVLVHCLEVPTHLRRRMEERDGLRPDLDPLDSHDAEERHGGAREQDRTPHPHVEVGQLPRDPIEGDGSRLCTAKPRRRQDLEHGGREGEGDEDGGHDAGGGMDAELADRAQGTRREGEDPRGRREPA